MSRTTGKTPPPRQSNRLEALWDDLLSRRPGRVRRAYRSLDDAGRRSVHAHLQRMVSEPGWQPEQVASARAALQALDERAK